LIALTAVITPIALMGTWPKKELPPHEGFFVACILALQTGMYGTFLAQDMFLFYFFWEVVLLPMFFLIGIWGGQNRIYATIKFFLYTLVGSLLMLVAIFWMVRETAQVHGQPSALFSVLSTLNYGDATPWLFLAFTLAFVIKVPMVPFHTWLPDAHVQAPTIGSVYLAAVLLKMGTYGLMRISLGFFPQSAFDFAPYLQALGVIGVIYGALCAMAQDDFKKLVAYSSVSHMGYVLLGLFAFEPLALAGSLYQMVNHGISSAGLFLIVGFLYERYHTRDLNQFGALAKSLPWMAIAFMVMTLSSVALPGTNGFVGEFTILLGSFQTAPVMTMLCGLGVILGAVYALKAYQKVMLGPSNLAGHHGSHHGDHADHSAKAGHGGHGHQHVSYPKGHDLSAPEMSAMVILTVLVFLIGFYPNSVFKVSEKSLENFHQTVMSKLTR
jgi:NADH-quinone oxidoreductase subunit M